MFFGGILESACLSLCLSVYKLLIILCRKFLTQFCFNCIETLQVHWSYIEALKDAIMKFELG